MKVIGGISMTSNFISSKIEFRNMVKVFNANKWHRVKYLEVNKTYGVCSQGCQVECDLYGLERN